MKSGGPNSVTRLSSTCVPFIREVLRAFRLAGGGVLVVSAGQVVVSLILLVSTLRKAF